MPDALAHYALSYLIASRMVKPKHALLIALIGLLPDIDSLFRIHRWVTHSLTLAIIPISVALAIAFFMNYRYLKYLALASTIYVSHVILDFFTAPTPILWPITDQAYMFNVELSGVVTEDGIGLTPSISIFSETVDFTQQSAVSGPLISTTGVIVAIGVVVMLLAEWLVKGSYLRRQR